MNPPKTARSRLGRLEPVDKESGLVNVVVDTPRASRCKYKYDDKSGVFRLSKLLPAGAVFPYNFGYVPSTRGEDGDPLDVLVLTGEAVPVGCVIPALLIGVLEAEQKEGEEKAVRNDRLLGVVQTPYNPPEPASLSGLNRQKLREIEHFFVSYNEMEGRHFKPLGWRGPDRARALLEKGSRRARRRG